MGGRGAPHGGPITVVPTTFARPTETVLHEGPGEFVGRVLDDEVRPLPEALIEVFRRKSDLVFQLALKTDEFGVFVVRGMAAGEYVVYVSKPGYRPHKPEIVVVEDGRTTRADWTLEPGPARDPFHTTKPYVWSVSAAACLMLNGQPVSGACTGGPSSWSYNVDEINNTLLMTLVVESRWAPTLGSCPGGVRNDVHSPDQIGPLASDAARAPSNPYHWDNLPQASSPTRILIDRFGSEATAMLSAARTELNGGANITTHGRWYVISSPHHRPTLGTPVDYGCMAQQSVTTAVTFFHGTKAPSATWTYFKS